MRKRIYYISGFAILLLAATYWFSNPSKGKVRVPSTGLPTVKKTNIDLPTLPTPHQAKTNGMPVSADGIPPSEIDRLLALRKAGNTNEYIRAMRCWLTSNRVDLFAADVMRLYAKARNTNEFRIFGISYATNAPNLLLEFADIAENEQWPEMNTTFAFATANTPDASFAQLRRSLRFLLDNGGTGDFTSILDRMSGMAQKRHEREYLSLLKSEIAVRNGSVDPSVADTLRTLSVQAMLPHVRKSAERLLLQLKEKP